MELDKLKSYLKKEEEQAFKGWDFTYLDGRWNVEKLPWDYKGILLSYLQPSYKLLDMGTGGGEFLLTLNHAYSLTSVTESYPANVQLCHDRLSPLGVDVRQVFDDRRLPFDTNTFELIINRHESFNIGEVKRILKNGGYFITQQVGGCNNNDLSHKLIEDFIPQFTNHYLEHSREMLINEGFDILLEEEVFNQTKFYDLGALVYFAKIIEWEFPGFSVDSCFDNLCKVQKELTKNGYVSGTQHRFIIVAKKRYMG